VLWLEATPAMDADQFLPNGVRMELELLGERLFRQRRGSSPLPRPGREARARASSRSAKKGLRPRLSAKRAVDGDLVESVLEDGELLLVEWGDEQFRDPA
jgi:hypothetical protein